MRLPAFRRAPAEYDERFMDTMATAYLDRTAWTELRLEAVRSLLDPRPGDGVLALGCAAGAVSHFLSGLGCETVGVDAEPLAIDKARGVFPGLHFQSPTVVSPALRGGGLQ